MLRGLPHPKRVLLACLVLSACSGTLMEKEPGTAQGNGGGDVNAGDPAPTCDDAVTVTDNGHHNPGQPCMQCHKAGGTGPQFTLGGTLYDGLNSTTAIDGATLRIVNASGTEVALHSALNGNFYTTQALAFPLTVSGSKCPDIKPMYTPVSEASADCNAAGCHDSTFRIHLP